MSDVLYFLLVTVLSFMAVLGAISLIGFIAVLIMAYRDYKRD